MPWERRGDFTGLVRELREQFRYEDEVKWTAVNRRSLRFYSEVIQQFFTRPWLMFHCIIVRKGYVKLELHKDFDEARRKHFGMLIKSKIRHFTGRAKDKAYHVRVDPLPSRYEKADEAAFKIVGSTLKSELGLIPLKSLRTVNSKTSPGIQVVDLLLGAVMSDWQEKARSPQKLQVRSEIAGYLGWKNLKADTPVDEWKFNIWHFHDPTQGNEREIRTRPVKLKIPMPLFQRRN